jgi:hypothetical protein
MSADVLSLASVQLAVCLHRVAQQSVWQPFRWALQSILPAAQCDRGPAVQHIALDIFRDECEGYYLNLTADEPCVFVVLRADENDPDEEPLVQYVTVSYNEAGRRMDAGEWVEQLPMPEPMRPWLAEFVEANYVPEPKKRKRPESFRSPADRSKPHG